jgi:hypothetical protein
MAPLLALVVLSSLSGVLAAIYLAIRLNTRD